MKRLEKTLARWSEAYLSTSRNSAIRLNYALSDFFSVRPLGRFSRPNGTITVTHNNSSTDPSTQTTDFLFVGYSSEDVRAFEGLPRNSDFVTAPPLFSQYSEVDDPLTFDLQKISLSLEEKNIFNPETNIIHYYKRTSTHTSLIPMRTNALQLLLIDSVAVAVSTCIVDES